MKRTFLTIADAISTSLGYASYAMVLILVAAMVYEVVARYIFGAPTAWAFDIAYMCTGVLFVLGAAQALREDAHVRIDFLSARLPVRMREVIEGGIYLLVLGPIFSLLTMIAAQRTWRAWTTGEVEHVSPWAPLMWPFYSALTIGLAGLTLQILAEGIRYLAAERRAAPFQIKE